MTIKCIGNEINRLPEDLHKFAFTQNEQGTVDLTLGKKYIVYGVRKNKWGEFYLILTDTVHTNSPWWMPQLFFEAAEDSVPSAWQKKSHGLFSRAWTLTDPAYFDAEQDIEDGTPHGLAVFEDMKQRIV